MLKIFGVPISVHTRKALVTALHKDIAYENVPVIPFDPPENWTALSPTGLIPAISHDGFDLPDSNAICAYLERIAPVPSIYPTDAKDFARSLWIEQYATTVLFRRVVHPLFHQKIIRPRILAEGGPDDAEIEEVVEGVAPGVFRYLEDWLSGDFYVDGTMTIADISISSALLNFRYLGFDLDGRRYPKLVNAFATTLRQASFVKAMAAEERFAERMGLDQSFLSYREM